MFKARWSFAEVSDCVSSIKDYFYYSGTFNQPGTAIYIPKNVTVIWCGFHAVLDKCLAWNVLKSRFEGLEIRFNKSQN